MTKPGPKELALREMAEARVTMKNKPAKKPPKVKQQVVKDNRRKGTKR